MLIVAVVVDKEGRRVKDTPQNYGLVVVAAVAEFLSIHSNLSLTVDKRYTNPNQQEQFQEAVQQAISKLAVKGTNVFFNSPVDSTKESLIQMADFVAGAFNFKYNRHDKSYVEIIKKKVKVEKVIKWNALKKRIVNPRASILTPIKSGNKSALR